MSDILVNLTQPDEIALTLTDEGDILVSLSQPETVGITLNHAQGEHGKSAYEEWLALGNTGSESVFIASLKGEDGLTPVKGVDYFDGTDGDDGREVELQKNVTYIQWRYVGELSWTDLVALADLKGAKGDDGLTPVKDVDYFDGDDGKSVEIQNSGTHIQWRLIGDVAWTNIVALLDLKGEKGDDGITPVKGVDYFDGVDGYTPIKGVDYFDGAKGDDGAKITSAAFSGNDILFTLDDASTVSLVDAKITLKGAPGDPATDTNTRVFTFVLHRGENATTGVNKTNKLIADKAYTITKAYAYATTAPTGASLLFDINVNGTTIWSTQANRLAIASASNSGTQTSFDTTTLAENDILSIDIDQIGSTIAGSDITVTLKCEKV